VGVRVPPFAPITNTSKPAAAIPRFAFLHRLIIGRLAVSVLTRLATPIPAPGPHWTYISGIEREFRNSSLTHQRQIGEGPPCVAFRTLGQSRSAFDPAAVVGP
jgi:hypothetical protein